MTDCMSSLSRVDAAELIGREDSMGSNETTGHEKAGKRWHAADCLERESSDERHRFHQPRCVAGYSIF